MFRVNEKKKGKLGTIRLGKMHLYYQSETKVVLY